MQRTENPSEPMAINLEGVARDLHKVKQLQEESEYYYNYNLIYIKKWIYF